MYKKLFKPLADFFIALIAIIVLMPVLLIVTGLLFISNQGKPFFFQFRPGKEGALFQIIKFKTMNDKKDLAGNFLCDGQRLTKIGKIVRKTSLDEIPQLLNVIKGDMSLIGPRPLLPEYMPIYNEFQKRRHEVMPGITGWAQVNGRNAISWQQKFEYDIWYVDNLTFALDVKIIFLTIKKVFKREGISSSTSETMEAFTQNNY